MVTPDPSCLSLGPAGEWGGCSRHSNVTTVSSVLSSSPCQEILLWFLEKSEREASLAALEGFTGLSSSVCALHPRCRFRAGSEGGAIIVVEEPIG